MKLSSNTLKNIAISAGIAAAAAGSASAEGIEAVKPIRTICKAAPIKPESRTIKDFFTDAVVICKAAPIKPESKTIKDFFTAADVNKDGKLSAEEFNNAYRAIVVQEKAKAAKAAKVKHPTPRVHIDNCPGCGLG